MFGIELLLKLLQISRPSGKNGPLRRSLFTPSFPRAFVAPLASFIARAVGLSRYLPGILNFELEKRKL
jgi:hypothetical protein